MHNGRIKTLGPAKRETVTRATLKLLCTYSFVNRAVCSRFRPGVGRMRRLRAGFYSAMWRAGAEAIGARFVALPGGRAEIRNGDRRLEVCENRTSIDDPATVARAGDKLVVRDLLAQAGIAVPRQVVVNIGEVDRALGLLKESTLGLVIKPAASTGAGAGVSTSVTDPRQLLTAIAWAHAYGRRILIEEQIPGDCYRVLVMDGEVLDIVIRRPPRVVGDGISTVHQLVRRENNLRRRLGIVRGQVLIRIDADLRNTIASQDFTLASQPRKGEIVVLKRVVNDNGTHENVSANGILGVAIVESARRAAQLVGTRLAGVDIICGDPNVPLAPSGGAVIEVNANPGLYYHYRSSDVGFPVTEEVLKRYFMPSDSLYRVSRRSEPPLVSAYS